MDICSLRYTCSYCAVEDMGILLLNIYVYVVKNIRGISFFVLKISMEYQKKYIMGETAWIFA